MLAGLAAAALYSLWYSLKAWRENRLVDDTPASRVRSAAQGYVELSGRAKCPPSSNIKGPLTHLECTWWRYEIERSSSSGRGREWTTIDSGTSELPFILDDGTGQCLVDPDGAQVFGSTKTVWYGSTEWPEVRIPSGQGFFEKLAEALIPKGPYRYTEQRLQLQDPICALGSYRSTGAAAAEDPEVAAAALLHDWKRDQRTLLARFDADHDGVLDAGEWEAARSAAQRQASMTVMTKPQPETPSMCVLSKPADGRAFILSASDGGSLARRLRRNAIGAAAACLGSSAAFIWLVKYV